MSDTLTADAPTTFTPEAIAGMRETWLANGLDPAAFDEAAGITKPAAADPVPPVAQPAAPTASGARTEGFTADQLNAMAQDLLAAGVPPDQVRAAVEADGGKLDLTPDTRTEEEIEYDRLYPPTTAADYRPSYYSKVPDGTAPGVVEEFHGMATEWAAAMQLAPEIGGALIEQCLDVGRTYDRASDADKALWRTEQSQTFTRLSGGEEAAQARLAAVRELLAKAPADFTKAMYGNGSLHDAHIVNLLALEAERLKLRS